MQKPTILVLELEQYRELRVFQGVGDGTGNVRLGADAKAVLERNVCRLVRDGIFRLDVLFHRSDVGGMNLCLIGIGVGRLRVRRSELLGTVLSIPD